MKSATVKFCCRFCKIEGQHVRGSPTYYCPPTPPLDGNNTINPEFHSKIYDIHHIPMRQHDQHVMKALFVQELGSDSSVGMNTGINGLPSI